MQSNNTNALESGECFQGSLEMQPESITSNHEISACHMHDVPLDHREASSACDAQLVVPSSGLRAAANSQRIESDLPADVATVGPIFEKPASRVAEVACD